ncbi:MAG: alpha/beta fold hydrolase [Gemmatimonadaceae bacterium]
MTPAVLALAATAALAVRVRFTRARRAEQRSKASLPVGPDGIIEGAQPLALHGTAPPAVLLLHGFGDTPQSLAALAASLHERGHDVQVPLLPGHGRTLRLFAATRADDWVGAARDAYVALRRTHPQIAIVGLSMGGAIAAILASEVAPAALVLLAPYLGVPTRIRYPARLHHLAALLSVYWAGGGEGSIHDPAERNKGLAYGVYTPRLVHELTRIVDRARAILPAITAPTLLVQSRHDNRIAASVAERAFAKIGTAVKRLEWRDVGGHVITVDHGKEDLFRMVAEWVESPTLQNRLTPA